MFTQVRKQSPFRVGLLLAVVLALAIIGFVQAAVIQEEARLTASDGAVEDRFGWSTAVSGDIALVGAPYDDDNASETGSAYIFTRDASGTWTQTTKLTASDWAAWDRFGLSAALSGDTALVGATYGHGNVPRSGAAYIFTRDASGTWSQTAKLTASDGEVWAYFGDAVAISGDTALVGASGSLRNRQGAYIFTPNASGVWNQTAKLTASDGALGDWFGSSVAVSGDTALVGAPRGHINNSFRGAAYLFTRDENGVWSQTARLIASDGEWGDYFGWSVAISEDTALVGAWADDANGPSSGSAYIFTRDESGAWSQTAKLTASDGARDDRFGYSTAISGDNALVGALGDDDHGEWSGSAYYFTRDENGVWSQTAKLTASDGAARDAFGLSVAISGDTSLIGAYADDTNVAYSGSAYIFQLNSPNNQAAYLMDDVSNLDLPAEQAALLTGPLQNLIEVLEDGNPKNDKAACNNLKSFDNEVRSLEKDGFLTETEAGELIQKADIIRTNLECQ